MASSKDVKLPEIAYDINFELSSKEVEINGLDCDMFLWLMKHGMTVDREQIKVVDIELGCKKVESLNDKFGVEDLEFFVLKKRSEGRLHFGYNINDVFWVFKGAAGD